MEGSSTSHAFVSGNKVTRERPVRLRKSRPAFAPATGGSGSSPAVGSNTLPELLTKINQTGWYERSESAFSTRSSIRSEEHTSELQSLMCISYAVFCLHKNNIITPHNR